MSEQMEVQEESLLFEDSTQIEEYDEISAWMQASVKKESLNSHIIEEIALEGLDGITLQALKERLLRRPGLPIQVTSKAMENVWNIAKKLHGIEFYQLLEPRPDLYIFCRSNYVDERWNWYEPLSAPEDIYPYAPVDCPDAKTIRGSCLHYKTRKLIPKIRTRDYKFVEETYGNSLVLVASQEFREAAIFGSDSDVVEDLTIIQYCMLERIARARYDGEMTRGKVSLNSMKIPPKALFYQRKLLLYKEMITKQLATMKFGKNHQTSIISILHLPRFYTPVVPIALENARRVICYLQKKPKMRADAVSIKKLFGKNLYRTLVSPEYSKIFKEETVLSSELHPEILLDENMEEKKEAFSKRVQKVLTYLNPETDVESLLPSANLVLSEEGDPGSTDDKNGGGGALQCTDKGILNLHHINLFDTQVHQVQSLIAYSGTDGITLPDIVELLQMSTLPARAAARYSVKLKISQTTMVEKDKTKVNKYIFCDKFPVDTSYSSLPPPPPVLHLHVPRKSHNSQKKNLAALQSADSQGGDGVKGKGKKQKKVKGTKTKKSSDSENLLEPTYVDLNICDGTKQSMEVKVEQLSVEHDMDLGEEHRIHTSQGLQESETLIIPDDIVTTKSSSSKVGKGGRKLIRLVAGKTILVTEKRRRQPRPTKSKRPPNHEGVYYDEKDQEALAKKNKQRVNWTVEEDQYMLLLFISSVVFIRRYNLNKLFIFNATQLRDMLHDKSKESANKTSLAIRRRLHFLIRNPTFKAKYQYCIHDAVNDEYIQKNFVDDIQSKLRDPQKIFHDIPTEAIYKVYDYLVQKYTSDNANMTSTSIATSTETDQYSEITSSSEPLYDDDMSSIENEYEINDENEMEFGVVENVEVMLKEKKRKRDDDMDAVVDLSSANLESTDRIHHSNKRRNVEVSAASVSPIQIIKCWTKKHVRKNVIDAESDASSTDELEKWIARTVVFALMFSGDSLDDVQPFLRRIGDANMEFVTNHFRRLNICTVSRRSHKFGLSPNMRRRLANHIQPESYRMANQLLDKMRTSYCGTHPAVSNNSASLFILAEFLIENMVSFNISISKEFSASNEEGPQELNSQPSLQKNALRKTKVPGEEALSVTLPSIKAKVDDDVESILYDGPRPSRLADLAYLTSHLLKVTPHNRTDDSLDSHMESLSRNYQLLLEFIEQGAELGVSMRLLLTKFTRTSLKKALIYLLSTNHIYMVGIAQRKFVSVKYILGWTMKIPSSCVESTLRLNRIIIHPWIASTGSINWVVVNVMFTAIIGILSNHPRIQVHYLIKLLNPVLSGVETMTLLEALIHFDFVSMHKFVRNDGQNLFSAPTSYYRDDDVDVFLDLEELSVELKPFVSLKYAHLQELFNPNPGAQSKED